MLWYEVKLIFEEWLCEEIFGIAFEKIVFVGLNPDLIMHGSISVKIQPGSSGTLIAIQSLFGTRYQSYLQSCLFSPPHLRKRRATPTTAADSKGQGIE